jgi:uncharacterized protein (TIGR02646 family)
MLKIRNGRLTPDHRNKLRSYQADVDAMDSYKGQVELAKSKFSQRNRLDNSAFRAVRSKLTDMCSGARRCMYCEDSVADEVEHFKPKDLYPEIVFEWMNYLYACGPCNGPKNNKFQIVNGDTLQDVTRPRGTPVLPPVSGAPALIDPRREDPLSFMMLDLRNTFEFSPIAESGTVECERAKYTIEVLRLNERDYLIDARENALSAFCDRLAQYIVRREDGAGRSELARRSKAIRRQSHPTVWAEMKRQRSHDPKLTELFDNAPEALGF